MKASNRSAITISRPIAALASLVPRATLHRCTKSAAHASYRRQDPRVVHASCISASVTSSVHQRKFTRPERVSLLTRLQVAVEAVHEGSDAQPLQEFSLLTSQGAIHTLLLTPGVSTVGNVRQMVADKTGWPAAQVRLAYAGIELPCQNDAQLFQVKAGNSILHTTKLEVQTAEPKVSAFHVHTMGGRVHKIPIQPGTTTGGDIRAAVAEKMGSSVAEVRLSYAGKEVDPNNDKQAFAVNPRITAMQAMQRMQGGQPAAASAGHRKRGDTSWTAPGAGRGFSAQVQLAKQFRDLMKNPMPGVSVAPDEQDEMKWHVKLAGPPGTPYEGGWFAVQLRFPNDFPGSRPSIHFMTPIWHPNISRMDHRVCVDLGDNVRSVACILSALQMLLAHPNTGSPLNEECAKMMLRLPAVFEKTAKEMTQQYAME